MPPTFRPPTTPGLPQQSRPRPKAFQPPSGGQPSRAFQKPLSRPTVNRLRQSLSKALLVAGVGAGALGGYWLGTADSFGQDSLPTPTIGEPRAERPVARSMRNAPVAANHPLLQSQEDLDMTPPPPAVAGPEYGDDGVVGYGNTARPGYDEVAHAAEPTPVAGGSQAVATQAELPEEPNWTYAPEPAQPEPTPVADPYPTSTQPPASVEADPKPIDIRAPARKAGEVIGGIDDMRWEIQRAEGEFEWRKRQAEEIIKKPASVLIYGVDKVLKRRGGGRQR